MKIAFLHMTMGRIERGSEVVVDSLAKELSKTHDVLVLQSGKVSKKPYKVKQILRLSEAPKSSPMNWVEKIAFRLHVDTESGLVAQFTKAAQKELLSFNPDIVVAINGPLQLKLLKGMGLKAKIVAFGHAGIGYHDRDTIRTCPDLFVALSPSAKEWSEKLAKKNTKVVYINNPFDPAPYQKAKPSKLEMTRPVVMVASSLSPHKNVSQVIKAVAGLEASLLLIGDGENSGVIEDILSQYPGEFRWIKSVEHDEIASYYKSADVFCFVPASQESFGMVYLEAMAAGLPIVATDDEIRRGIIGQQGIYVDPNHEVELKEAIRQAATYGRLNYSSQLQSCSLKSVVSQIEKEFYALIA